MSSVRTELTGSHFRGQDTGLRSLERALFLGLWSLGPLKQGDKGFIGFSDSGLVVGAFERAPREKERGRSHFAHVVLGNPPL